LQQCGQYKFLTNTARDTAGDTCVICLLAGRRIRPQRCEATEAGFSTYNFNVAEVEEGCQGKSAG